MEHDRKNVPQANLLWTNVMTERIYPLICYNTHCSDKFQEFPYIRDYYYYYYYVKNHV